MLCRVLSPLLDPIKCWYPVNQRTFGPRARKLHENPFFKLCPREIQNVCVETLRTEAGDSVDKSYFGAKHSVTTGLVVSTLGLFGSILKQQDPASRGFFGTEAFRKLASVINAHCIISGKQIINSKSKSQKGTPVKLVVKSKGSWSPRSPGKSPKRKKLRLSKNTGRELLNTLEEVCNKQKQSLAALLAHLCCNDSIEYRSQAREIVSEAIKAVTSKKGVKRGLELLAPDVLQRWKKSLRVPDWQYLYLKQDAKISDDGWQSVINLTNLGRTGKECDADILINKNQITAARRMLFQRIRCAMNLSSCPKSVEGMQVGLVSTLIWLVRELRLHGQDLDVIDLNIKLDGRPFWGKDQVMVGIVPLNSPFSSTQSCKAVWPLVIANCKETRNNLEDILSDLVKEKQEIQRDGLQVDGKHYRFQFSVTADYKALILCTKKTSGEEVKLCGQGMSVELCIFCKAIRGCSHKGVGPDETCAECLVKAKGDVGKWTGIRDDLKIFMDTEIKDVNLCALHCALRNLEQLLVRLGLLAYNCGCLKKCNAVLAEYGPKTMVKDRIVVKLKENQSRDVNKTNIKLRSFSGNTGRKFMENYEDIINRSLPLKSVITLYPDQEAAEAFILKEYQYCEERKMYFREMLESGVFVRDNGADGLENISLTDNKDIKQVINEKITHWEGQLKDIGDTFETLCDEGDIEALRNYAASLKIAKYKQVFGQWDNIEKTMRDRVFAAQEDVEIDKYDIQCKEWGFLCRDTFGMSLGSGDYGHMAIEHSPMLMRRFRSMGKYSNQGFEAAHKLHRQLYAQCTNHDATASGTSIEQMFLHHYTTKLLYERLCFRRAEQRCLKKCPGERFFFRGCGWPLNGSKGVWDDADVLWIKEMNALFEKMMGGDFLSYETDPKKNCVASPINEDEPFFYNHEEWEKEFEKRMLTPKIDSDLGGDRKKEIRKPAPKRCLFPSSSKASNRELCLAPTAPREELISVCLPAVTAIKEEDCVSLQGPFAPTDPLLLESRPSETVVDKCIKLMNPSYTTSNDQAISNIIIDGANAPSGVVVGHLGSFDERGVNILQSFCAVAALQRDFKQEMAWLNRRCTEDVKVDEKKRIRDVLKKSPNNPGHVIASFNNVQIDLRSFTTLIGERYVDNFTINYCIRKMLSTSSMRSFLCLPTEAIIWIQNERVDLIKDVIINDIGSDPNSLRLILVPTFMEPNHWGITCVDVMTQTIWFDDGMTRPPPPDLPTILAKLMSILSLNFPTVQRFKDASVTMAFEVPKRMGMPQQKDSVNGEGCGSCGVGVVLVAKDIIDSGQVPPPHFTWAFSQSSYYRKKLMALILD